MENFKSRISLQKLEYASGRIKSIAHPVRLAIIDLLRDGAELAVNQIQTELNIEQTAASYHLIQMKNKKILSSTKRANKVYYSLSDLRIPELIDSLYD